MPIIPLDIPPGVVKSDSPNAAKGRYTDTDKVRFIGKYPEKWGGWTSFFATALTGVPRGCTAWTTGVGNQNLAVGTHKKLYVITGGDTLEDITPYRDSGTLGTDPFAITSGSTTVTVTDASHGVEVGAYVHFASAGSAALLDRTLGTPIGNATGGGNLAASFDGTTAQAAAACSTRAAATSAYVGKTLALAAPIHSFVVYGSNDAGFVSGANPNVTLKIYGKNGTAPASGTDGTELASLAPFADTADQSAGKTVTVSSPTTTTYDHVWVYLTHDGAAAQINIAEVVMNAYFFVDGTYIVQSTPTSGTYTITHTVAAKTTDATVGSTTAEYDYEINIGNQHPGYGTGWGMGAWGHDAGWGEEISAGGLPEDMRHWSLWPYGHNLLAAPFAGTLYDWDEDTDDQAQIITNAPDYMRGFFVTPERYVFALGTDNGSSNDPMRIQWPDQDDITDWTPTSSNTANSRTLQNGSKIMAGCPLQDLLSLVWTDTSLYLFQYTVGSDFIYEDRLAGENCGLIGPLSYVNVSGTAFWMSAQDFHMYSGGVQPVPNSQDIASYVLGRLQTGYGVKTNCQYNAKVNSIVWFYVSTESEDFEPDSYVEVCLDTFAWSVGSLRRSSSTTYRPHTGEVVMFDPDGASWLHEDGHDADQAALEAYITYGEYQLAEGEQNVDIMGFIPDCQRQQGLLSIELYTKDRPNSDMHFDEQTVILDEGQGIGDCRVSGRVFSFTVRSNEVSGDFRLGTVAVEVQDAGNRR